MGNDVTASSKETLFLMVGADREAKDLGALELLRSLDGEPESGAAEAWDAEIERRGAEVESGTADAMTLEEYRAHVRQRRATRTRR